MKNIRSWASFKLQIEVFRNGEHEKCTSCNMAAHPVYLKVNDALLCERCWAAMVGATNRVITAMRIEDN